MGIPPHLREQVAEYGNALADVENQTEQSLDPMMGLFALAQELAEEKRRNPDGRLLSAMVNDTTLNLDPMQINQFVLVFAMAGHETTRSTAAHFVYLMHKHPEQYALLRSDFDAHIDNAIDEVLRFTSTTTNFTRAATEDTEIGGYPVKRETISICLMPRPTAILRYLKTRTASTSPAPMQSATLPLASGRTFA